MSERSTRPRQAERAQGLIERSAQACYKVAQQDLSFPPTADLADRLREEVLALNAVEEAARSRAASIMATLNPLPAAEPLPLPLPAEDSERSESE